MQRTPDNFANFVSSRDTAVPTTPVHAPLVNAPLARRIAGHALLLGIAGDVLLRDLPVGLAFPVWIALLVLAMTAAAWSDGREISRETAGWLATAMFFSAGFAWRDSATLQSLDFVATLGALGMAAIALSHASAALLAARFRETIWAAAALVRTVIAGFVPIAMRELFSTESRGAVASRIRPAIRALLIAATLLVVFGTLLRDADPIFASLVTLPSFDIGTIASHVVVVAFYAWLVSGWARAALVVDVGERRAPDTLPFGLSLLDITTALGTLNVLFAAFVATQLGWFFGGEAFLRARTGLTVSTYARQGFFEMLWVAMLVIPLLVATRAALKPGRELERRHTMLSIPVDRATGRHPAVGRVAHAALRSLLRPHHGAALSAGVHGMAGRRARVARVHRAARTRPSIHCRRRAVGPRGARRTQRRRARCVRRPLQSRARGTRWSRRGHGARSS